MAVSLADFRAEVGSKSTTDEYLQSILDQGDERVTHYLEGSGLSAEEVLAIPLSVRDEAVLACACEIYNIRQAPNGILNQQFSLGDGSSGATPVRIGGDPMRPVRPLLSPWIGGLTI